jgi:BirA family biotin operon repressor/biotin-[acetyl-CoA-carboxylase] ligase
MWLNLSEVHDCLTTESLGRRIVYLSSTGSTMDVARREAEEGAEEGTVVVAEEQTAGRGRFGRAWVSPTGKNIYATLILRPDARGLRLMSVIAPLAVCRAAEDIAMIPAQIKWPNDVLVNDRKLSGILIENEFSGSLPRYALVGIGVNVNFDVEESAEIALLATSLKRESGHEISREGLLAALLNHFEVLYRRTPRESDVLSAWKSRLETLGRTVTVTFRGQSHVGVAEDVDARGNLLLRQPDGSLMTIEAGEVTLRAPE